MANFFLPPSAQQSLLLQQVARQQPPQQREGGGSSFNFAPQQDNTALLLAVLQLLRQGENDRSLADLRQGQLGLQQRQVAGNERQEKFERDVTERGFLSTDLGLEQEKFVREAMERLTQRQKSEANAAQRGITAFRKRLGPELGRIPRKLRENPRLLRDLPQRILREVTDLLQKEQDPFVSAAIVSAANETLTLLAGAEGSSGDSLLEDNLLAVNEAMVPLSSLGSDLARAVVERDQEFAQQIQQTARNTGESARLGIDEILRGARVGANRRDLGKSVIRERFGALEVRPVSAVTLDDLPSPGTFEAVDVGRGLVRGTVQGVGDAAATVEEFFTGPVQQRQVTPEGIIPRGGILGAIEALLFEPGPDKRAIANQIFPQGPVSLGSQQAAPEKGAGLSDETNVAGVLASGQVGSSRPFEVSAFQGIPFQRFGNGFEGSSDLWRSGGVPPVQGSPSILDILGTFPNAGVPPLLQRSELPSNPFPNL